MPQSAQCRNHLEINTFRESGVRLMPQLAQILRSSPPVSRGLEYALKPHRTPGIFPFSATSSLTSPGAVTRPQTQIGMGKRSPLKPIWPATLLEINSAPQEGLHYLSLLWN